MRAVESVLSDRRARGVGAVPGAGRELFGAARIRVGRECTLPPPGGPPPTFGLLHEGAASATTRRDRLETSVELRQSFVIAHPVDEVWAFFGRVEDVAACLPGASLDGGEKDGVVNGKMRVKVGPISAEFNGVAQITRDEATHRGAIVGSGRDTRSNSATRGSLRTPLSRTRAALVPASMLTLATRSRECWRNSAAQAWSRILQAV